VAADPAVEQATENPSCRRSWNARNPLVYGGRQLRGEGRKSSEPLRSSAGGSTGRRRREPGAIEVVADRRGRMESRSGPDSRFRGKPYGLPCRSRLVTGVMVEPRLFAMTRTPSIAPRRREDDCAGMLGRAPLALARRRRRKGGEKRRSKPRFADERRTVFQRHGSLLGKGKCFFEKAQMETYYKSPAQVGRKLLHFHPIVAHRISPLVHFRRRRRAPRRGRSARLRRRCAGYVGELLISVAWSARFITSAASVSRSDEITGVTAGLARMRPGPHVIRWEPALRQQWSSSRGGRNAECLAPVSDDGA